MKAKHLIPATILACAGVSVGQGLYNIMPYDDEPVEALPLHWTAAFSVGYDSNPSPVLSDCSGFDSDSAAYVSGSIQGNLVMSSAQTVVDTWLRLGVTYYLDDIQQTSPLGTTVGSADDTFYTVQGGLNITHHVNERVRLRSRTNLAFEQEPDFDSGIATDRRQGQYLRYSSDNSFGYRWTERLGTVTGYRVSGVAWDDSDSFAEDQVRHLFYNQFRYRTSESTVLTADVRYGYNDNDTTDSESLYLLVGIEHQFSPNTVGVLRVGGQHFSPDSGSDEWSPYVEGTIKTQVNEQFGVRAFVYYGIEDRDRSIWIHDCNAVGPMPTASPALARYNERNILRIGTQGSYVLSERLTLFGGLNVVLQDYQDGNYLNNGGTWVAGDSAPDFDEAIFNVNLGASLQVAENVFMTGSYNYTDSSSDADIRDYDRHRFQLGVQTSF